MAAIVEYAKSGRSQCCVCCQKITLDAIRFRMPLEAKWRCLECFTPVEHQTETEIECHGAGKLSTEDQLLLAELLQTRLKGARLGALWLRSEELCVCVSVCVCGVQPFLIWVRSVSSLVCFSGVRLVRIGNL